MRARTNKLAAVSLVATAAVMLSGCNSDGNGGAATGATAPAASTTPAATPSAAPAAVDNGIAALSSDKILKRARAAIKGVKSYRFTGKVDAEGERMGLDFKVSGKDMAGTMDLGKAKVQLLSVRGNQYLKGDRQFWSESTGSAKDGKTMAKLIGDRWAKIPAEEEGLGELFNAASIDELLTSSGKVTKGATKEIGGIPAIGLVDKGREGGTLYIATVGEPYPLRIEAPDGDGQMMTFSDFGKTFPEIKAPAEADVVDFGDMTG
ncbi:hypothetical protein [Jidongwangia harbinensis]|uniref:hypothetical protein n=1 Tax=Jidongwangia harbinensis TaxID=2878561 RepID=UPI001CD989EA|nr:hypothetical protein [Jidongwangia harbinensis]MCA2211405.1 hypothetical protein [Jidongwangia harbinensis]